MSTPLAISKHASLDSGLASNPSSSWLAIFSKLVCLSVVFLIFKGALVTSNDAGLAVPDWPTSFGENMFLFPPSKWTGIIFYEHVHRLIASVVGLLTVILTVWIWLVEKRRWLKILSLCALSAVILQGILGGLTVLYLLPTAVSSAHAVLGQTFFLMTLLIAYGLSKEGSVSIRISKARHKLFFPAVISLFAVYLQLIVGAAMRHSEAGLAVLDLVTIGGEYFPSFSDNMLSTINSMRSANNLSEVSLFQVALHVAHRLGGIIISFLMIWLLINEVRIRFSKGERATLLPFDYKISRNVFVVAFVVVIQFTLGMLSVYSLRNPWIASSHVFVGAILLGMLTLLCIRLFRAR